jgi:inner membrane protein
MHEPSPPERPIAPMAQPTVRSRLGRHRTLIKLAGIAALALLLLIPLALLLPVVAERTALRNEAVGEIRQGWGQVQAVIGPVLVIPLRERGFAYVFPDELRVDGQLVPEQRRRGIYRAVVYTARLQIAGTFQRPQPAELGVAADQLLWDQAFVALAVPDLRGVTDAVQLSWGAETTLFRPGSRLEPWRSGLSAPVSVPGAGPVPFALDLPLRGSLGIRFAPVGAQNQIALRSGWPSPHFAGEFLPTARDVGGDGFTASWRISHYGQGIPHEGHDGLPVEAIDASLFGVDLLLGLDAYRSVERAIKYGVLFVVLCFMSFFLFEVLARVRIHPFQYGMVGLAIGTFFLLLLALSELLPFAVGYAAAAGATVALLSIYMLSVLGTGRRTLVGAATLGSSFALLYVVLQAEDYALVAGSAVIFAALALTMRLTRAVDWYAEDEAA